MYADVRSERHIWLQRIEYNTYLSYGHSVGSLPGKVIGVRTQFDKNLVGSGGTKTELSERSVFSTSDRWTLPVTCCPEGHYTSRRRGCLCHENLNILYHTDNSDGSNFLEVMVCKWEHFYRLIKQHHPIFYTVSFQKYKRALWKQSSYVCHPQNISTQQFPLIHNDTRRACVMTFRTTPH